MCFEIIIYFFTIKVFLIIKVFRFTPSSCSISISVFTNDGVSRKDLIIIENIYHDFKLKNSELATSAQ